MVRSHFTATCDPCFFAASAPMYGRGLAGIINQSTRNVYLTGLRMLTMNTGAANVISSGQGPSNQPPGSIYVRRTTAVTGGDALTAMPHDTSAAATSISVVSSPTSVTNSADIPVIVRTMLSRWSDNIGGSMPFHDGSYGGLGCPGTSFKGSKAGLLDFRGSSPNAHQPLILEQNKGLSFSLETEAIRTQWFVEVLVREVGASNVTTTFYGYVCTPPCPGDPFLSIYNSDADDVEIISIIFTGPHTGTSAVSFTSGYFWIPLRLTRVASVSQNTVVTALAMDTTAEALPSGVSVFRNGICRMFSSAQSVMTDDPLAGYGDFSGASVAAAMFSASDIHSSRTQGVAWGMERFTMRQTMPTEWLRINGFEGLLIPPYTSLAVLAGVGNPWVASVNNTTYHLGTTPMQSHYAFEFQFSVEPVAAASGVSDMAYIG